MSLNDVCCYMLAWFGAMATTLTALMAYECTVGSDHCSIFGYLVDLLCLLIFASKEEKSTKKKKGGKKAKPPSDASDLTTTLAISFPSSPALEVALCTAATMCMVPAHLMRSIGSGYDNESVAVTAMCLTFYLWMRSLRFGNSNASTTFWGVLSGIVYFYMAAVWGGYVFVLNMIGVHAVVLFLIGRFSDKVYIAYTMFYLVGTTLAVQISVVGWTPLKSLEQLGPCAVFVVYQLLALTNIIAKRKGNVKGAKDLFLLRVQVFAVSFFLIAVAIHLMAPTGYFGPFTSRVQ